MKLTEGWIDANKVVIGIALAVLVLATLAYLLRRLKRESGGAKSARSR